MGEFNTKIAVIGAGMAALSAASELSTWSSVSLFEKSRGVGGRMATRYQGDLAFDFGAQYFTVRDNSFKAFLNPYLESQVVQLWEPAFVELKNGKLSSQRQWKDSPAHYVGAEKMTSLCKALAKDHEVHIETRIIDVQRKDKYWYLTDQEKNTHGPFDWVISSAPPEQTADIFPNEFAHAKTLPRYQMSPCYTLMLGFQHPLPISWEVAFIKHPILSWMSCNHTKPGRPPGSSYVINSTNAWAAKNQTLDIENVMSLMLNELESLIGSQLAHYTHIDCQKWRYANIEKQKGPKAYIDNQLGLGAFGDWCIQGRVESAYLSGTHIAAEISSHHAN